MKRRYPLLIPAGTCFVCAAALCVLAAAAGEPGAPAAGAPDARLAFTAAGKEYTFNTGVLRGTLREGGKSMGLKPLVDVASGARLAASLGILSPYRLLTADARFGTAAWDWPSEARPLPDGAVEVRWAADAQHPLEMTAVYRWSAPNVLDFSAAVRPRQDLRNFELFLASYFDGFPASFVYVAENPGAGGKPGLMEAVKSAGVWQAFPRDDEAPKIIADGRWNRPPNPVAWKIMPRIAGPLAVRRDARTGLAAVLLARPEDCFAVSTPCGEEGHRSVYLSLFGRDLKAGESAAASARLIVGRDISDEQAIALYREYVKK